MSDKESVIKGLQVRLWAVEGGVHPLHTPIYLGLAKLGDPSQSTGDATRIAAPDPNDFNRDITVGSTPGTEERGTITVSERYTVAQSRLIKWYREKCRTDLYGLVGICGNPQDFDRGGDKWVYFPDCRPSNIAIENFSAFSKDESNPAQPNLDMTFEQFWEFLRIGTSQIHSDVTTREIMVVVRCDRRSCGECDEISGGCNKIFAVMLGTGATPGTQPTLIYSDDGFVTYSTQTIDTLFSTERVAMGTCIAGDLVLISTEGNEIHYTNISDIFIGLNDWEENDTGFVVGGEPLAIYSVGPSDTWIVGNGGYIYYTRNHRASVTVQDAGVATTQNLNCVHAANANNVIAVGNSNAVVVTRNGGDVWETRTGPAAGENLSVCWMLSNDTWFVGTGAGGSGKLYVTNDGGYTWTQVDLPVSGVSRFDRLIFASGAEGFLAYRSGGNGYILRTINAGATWMALPDSHATKLPKTDYFNDLAVCEEDSNTVFAGGLDDDASSGMLIKGEGVLAD